MQGELPSCVESNGTVNWYLLHTNPRKEELVARQLHSYDLEIFFPTVSIQRGYSRGIREEALFPHYLFVKADLLHRTTPDLGRLPGVRNLVHFGEQPVTVPEIIIEYLRRHLARNKSAVTLADYQYKPGQRVRIRIGPFEGLDAVFQKGIKGSERVQILVQVLGQLSPMELDLRAIEAS